MGKPRMIILIRHAQSEGNKNREIHQTVPDHRVKLTAEGWKQAEAAGLKLRSLLRPDDTLHFFTSPYRRTRETTEGILSALTSSNPAPSPFPRHAIKVYEEPRLREQDFGNFQPGSQEMTRMWSERAEYVRVQLFWRSNIYHLPSRRESNLMLIQGHFFYRIPNGESAADAYDRVSGFNDTLWRSFGDDDFASVCVLVTHGLMTRVFLMKWYHFSVEYFEDLRNVDHCEFVVMKKSKENQKYILQNELRTWSAFRKEKAEVREPESPIPVRKKWAGYQDGNDVESRRRQARRKNTADMFADDISDAPSIEQANVRNDGPTFRGMKMPAFSLTRRTSSKERNGRYHSAVTSFDSPLGDLHRQPLEELIIPDEGRDGGGSRSGAPSRSGSDESDEPPRQHARGSMAMALRGQLGESHSPHRARADALGDQSDVDEEAS